MQMHAVSAAKGIYYYIRFALIHLLQGVPFKLLHVSVSSTPLTEPRRALQPKGTQWFPWIGLFVIQANSLVPCRRLIEFLTSSHPCGRLSKIQNSQIHKVEIWKFLSNFPRKDFSVISHEHKDKFFVVIRPIKTPGHIKYWPRIDLTKVGHF